MVYNSILKVKASVSHLILLVLVCILFTKDIHSQSTDSLHNIWGNNQVHDTVRLEAGFQLFMRYFRSLPDSARTLAEQMLTLATTVQNVEWQATSSRLIGNTYGSQGIHDKALEFFEISRELAHRSGDKRGLSISLNNLGIVSYEQGLYPKALGHLQESRKLAEELRDTNSIARAYNNIGNVYYRQKDYALALDFYQNGGKWKEALGDQHGLSMSYNNIGLVYLDQGDLIQALKYFEECLSITQRLGDKEGIARTYHNIGGVLTQQGRYGKALDYFKKAIDIRESLGNQQGLASTYLNIGQLFMKQKAYDESRSWCMRSLPMARIMSALHMERDACKCLAESYEQLGNHRQALVYHKQFFALNDSIFNEKNTKALTSLNLTYSFEKQQLADSLTFAKERAEIETEMVQIIHRRNNAIFIGLFFLFITGIIVFFYLRSREHRRMIAHQESELNRERELNERLQQVDRLKDQFLANTSHELRTPLQGIIGLSEALLSRSDDRRDQDDLAMVISSGSRLNSLVNDLLDFSKLKNAQIQLDPLAVDLHSLVEVVIHSISPLARGKSLNLVNKVPVDLKPVWADENRLQQVLYNLLGNSIKFTEKGQIKVSAQVVKKDDKNRMEITVQDSGIGIPENKMGSIFQEFEQVDASESREFAGTGLGLSISKRLIEMHEGEMWVESVVGEGSVFYFTLPISRQKVSKKLKVATVYRPIALNTPLKVKPIIRDIEEEKPISILVVDDEPVNQQVLSNYLEEEHYQLSQAFNGEEAMELITSSNHYDLVLLDIMMPRMTGYEVCAKIRLKYLPSELPIILITAKNQVDDLVQGLALGANDYLAKPFNKEELIARVRTQLDLHRIFDIAGRFVPQEFLRSLGRERITDVQLGDLAEHRVTVLFSDIRDYTALAETMTPKETFQFMSTFNGRLGPMIHEHNGFVNQYLGDSIMAIFTKSSNDALEAAIAMHHRLHVYNMRRKQKNRKLINIGVGLHTGPLVMGIIGDEKRMDAATIADTVNAASRMEGLTKHYGANILISEDSKKQIPDTKKFNLRYLGRVFFKGKKEAIGIYECFDGDLPEMITNKQNTLNDFQKALNLFFAREFLEASDTFKQILEINPNDQVTHYFNNRSSKLAIDGVPEDWTGAEVLVNK